MALTIGLNSGFVTTAPTADPATTTATADNRSLVTHDTSPATAVKIIEVGWFCVSATPDVNYEVGLYAADGTVVPNEAGTLLNVSRTNAKGTTAGWKVVSGLNWTISPSTPYFLGLQLDNTVNTAISAAGSGGTGNDAIVTQTTLPDPFGGGSFASTGKTAIYAIWEAASVGGTNIQINIGDAWKSVAGMQINIGDVWKSVASAQINIGDAWKTIF